MMGALIEWQDAHNLECVPRSPLALYEAHPLPDFELV
jgi:hypothetical protein